MFLLRNYLNLDILKFNVLLLFFFLFLFLFFFWGGDSNTYIFKDIIWLCLKFCVFYWKRNTHFFLRFRKTFPCREKKKKKKKVLMVHRMKSDEKPLFCQIYEILFVCLFVCLFLRNNGTCCHGDWQVFSLFLKGLKIFLNPKWSLIVPLIVILQKKMTARQVSWSSPISVENIYIVYLGKFNVSEHVYRLCFIGWKLYRDCNDSNVWHCIVDIDNNVILFVHSPRRIPVIVAQGKHTSTAISKIRDTCSVNVSTYRSLQ